jgi:predicted ABC-type ATPase
VNEKKIVSRYWKSLQNINTLLELCDILHVYDNSGDKPVRIIRKHKDQLSVFPNTLWSVDSILDLMNGNITEQK